MTTLKSVAQLAMAALLLTGCVSTRPRPYAPTVEPPPADVAAFESAFSDCAADVSAEARHFKPSSAPIVGAAGGAAAADVLAGAATATVVGGGSALAATGVGMIALIPLATYGLTSSRRKKNERVVQAAMTSCLAEKNYAIVSWTRMTREEAAAVTLVSPTRHEPPPPPRP